MCRKEIQKADSSTLHLAGPVDFPHEAFELREVDPLTEINQIGADGTPSGVD